jgi:hypothetical protein
MPSSTSSSEWRRFFALVVGAAAGAAALLYAFIVAVDPFDALPLSPPLARAPVSTNARFSFPALGRSAAFDSAVIGTSTSRLLRPAALDSAFGGARFVNLSMNAATAYEQARILGVFLRAHPHPRAIIVGLDIAWCGIGPQPRFTERPFPEWMYGRDRWRGYREVFNLFALTEAWAQFLHVTGLKRSRYGLDGYTSFVPDDRLYDPARVAVHLAQDEAGFARADIAGDAASWRFPALDLLGQILADIPAGTPTVLYFVPYNHVLQQPGTDMSDVWTACKARATMVARARRGVVVADFMIPSSITGNDNNYWDALHYRVGIADQLAADLAAASRGDAAAAGDYRLLATP